MKCEVCGREFEAKRSDAKYCSAKCRVKAKRLSVTDGELSVTKPALSVTGSVTDKLNVTTVVTDKEEVESKIRALKSARKNRDRDDFFSPDYDLSEAGFIRRNRDWRDNSTYPGTPESREACMAAVKNAHTKRMREIYG